MIRRFKSFLYPVRAMLAAGLAMSMVAAAMEWLAPWPLKFVFDSVLGHKPLPALLHWMPHGPTSLLVALGAAMATFAGVLAVADYLSTRFVATAGQRVVFDVRNALFEHVTAQGPSFFEKRKTGDLLARLGGDVQAIQSAVVTAVPTLVRNAMTLFGMIVIMLVVDWRYALLAMALAPLLYFVSRRYLFRIKAVQRKARRCDGEASAVAQEVLTSITAVQAFGAERLEACRYSTATARGLEENRRAIVAQAEFTPIMTLAMTVSTVLVLFFGVRAVTAGHLTAGDLLVFTAYLRGMYSPVRQLSKLAGVVSRAHAAAERVAEIMDAHEGVPERPTPRRLARARGHIELAGVHFAYPGGTTVLDGVDLEVPAGTRQALVGLTGSGKSTVIRLLPRFLDPDAGTVRIDGVDISELSLGDLRRQLALVPQEPYLFGATVWENISYGTRGADPTRVAGNPRSLAIAAAKAAGLHEVIACFPGGYDATVGERGATLSGGQRQCVAVARAMARDAPILLLDEPTVGLDAELESVLVSAMEHLADGRTTIVVSHQLGGLRRADQIAVLSRGRISEAGTHEQLLAYRRVYWRLNHLQHGGTAPDPVDLRLDRQPVLATRGEP